MRRIPLMLVLLASVSLTASAHAGPELPSADGILRQAMDAIIVPVEWDGIWTTEDSVYTCAGVFQSTNASTDTICGGKDYSSEVPEFPITFTCTGTATATTMNMTCTGSMDILTCTVTYTLVTHGTRSDDSYRMVTTLDIAYSGVAPECSFLPSSCTQTNSWGTRTGPAPPAYCSTPARPATWGHLKTMYR